MLWFSVSKSEQNVSKHRILHLLLMGCMLQIFHI
jgi:hypothetical protein